LGCFYFWRFFPRILLMHQIGLIEAGNYNPTIKRFNKNANKDLDGQVEHKLIHN
jgi:hypothetical protein